MVLTMITVMSAKGAVAGISSLGFATIVEEIKKNKEKEKDEQSM